MQPRTCTHAGPLTHTHTHRPRCPCLVIAIALSARSAPSPATARPLRCRHMAVAQISPRLCRAVDERCNDSPVNSCALSFVGLRPVAGFDGGCAMRHRPRPFFAILFATRRQVFACTGACRLAFAPSCPYKVGVFIETIGGDGAQPMAHTEGAADSRKWAGAT